MSRCKYLDLRDPEYSRLIAQNVTPQYHPETGEFRGWRRGKFVYEVHKHVSIGQLLYEGFSVYGGDCTFYYHGDDGAFINAGGGTNDQTQTQ